jgi:hypothetical protein
MSWRRLSVLALLAAAMPLAAAPILDYPALRSDALPALAVPVSAFHDDAGAQQAAAKILEAWKTEPASLAWTRVQLERHIKHKASPTRAARGLALVHVAMHDAYELAGGAGLDRRLALSMAAATVLGYLYTAEEHAFDRIAFDLAGQLSGAVPEKLPPPVQRALALGRAVGERVVARAQDDGAQRGWNGSRLQWYGDGRYYGPDAWEPTPPYFYYPPDEPFAPGWKTWVLARADAFRPAPPEFESEKFLKDLKEVIDINRTLTPEQLRIAKFWVDGHGSVTPPGHWNQIAMDAAKAAKLDEGRTVELFADLNIAMADAFIATWDCKYHYWTMRPITAAKKVYGVDYQPAILTPPFPSYPSGHASFSGAAARILGAYLPEAAQRYDAMALEAATSRMYGGIHYRHDNEDGLELGRKVAGAVLAQRQGAQ